MTTALGQFSDRPSPRATQAERAFRILEEMIITGVLSPGESVTETSLSERLGIGRTPVREAVQRLATNQLVAIRPRQGITVTAVDFEHVRMIFETRRPLERILARLATRSASDDDRTSMRRGAADLVNAAASGDGLAVIAADAALKEIAIRAAANEFLSTALGPIHALCKRLYYIAVPIPDQTIASAYALAYRFMADGAENEAVQAMDAAVGAVEQTMSRVPAGRTTRSQ